MEDHWENSYRVATKDKIIELKEDRCLFARMIVICKSRPEIDIEEAVGVHDFSVVPRSIFAADGNMLHCSAKSALMSILEKLPRYRSVEQAEPTELTVVIRMKLLWVFSTNEKDFKCVCKHLKDS